MGIRYIIDGKLLVMAAYGAYTMDQVFLAFGKVMADGVIDPPINVLMDVRHAKAGLSNEEIEMLAVHLSKFKTYFDGRWAVVAEPNTLMFGLSRMFCCLAESQGLTVEPFSDYDAACEWLLESECASSS